MSHKPGTLSIQDSAEEFRRDVLNGLAQPQKAIPGKYLWDEVGSGLFDEITETASYYATRAETALLREAAPDLAAFVGEQVCIVEFGSGACHKVDILLEALERPRRYVAIDISDDFLRHAVSAMQASHPDLDIRHVCADYSRELPLLPLSRSGAVLGFFPGTSIGNMPPREASSLLTRIREALGASWLLVGLDPNRDAGRIQHAYGSGLMAAFHENILRRMAREIDADLRVEDFRHEARVIADPARVEAHLVAQRRTAIEIVDTAFAFEAGESIRTDVSWKYTPSEFRDLAASAGWTSERSWVDPGNLFLLMLLRGA